MRITRGLGPAALATALAILASGTLFVSAASAGTADGALKCSLPKYNPTKYALGLGQTTTCTITGASDATGLLTVPVIIQSSNFGNSTGTGTVSVIDGSTTITFTFTAPSGACNTAVVSYIKTGNIANNSWITTGGKAASGFAFVDSSGNAAACGSVPESPIAKVYLGYADNFYSHGDPLGLPWNGMPAATTIFVGCGGYPTGGVPAVAQPCEKVIGSTTVDSYDAGAIRIDNTSTTTAMPVTGGAGEIGDCTYNPWGGTMNISIPPGFSLVLTQTGGPKPCDTDEVGPYNFDTSESALGCTPSFLIPVVTLKINGNTVTINDTGQILNTGGVDVGGCGAHDEFHAFTQVL